MATLDASALSAVLKQIYDQDEVYTLSYSNEDTFFAMVAKDEEFYGANKAIALRYATPLGLGASIADAQANKTTSLWDRFTLTRNSYFGTASITTEAIRASKGDAAALVEGLRSEIDGLIHSVTRKVAKMGYGNGGGAIGRVANTVFTGQTLTLTNPGDIVNFEKGMVFRLATTDGTSGSLETGSLTIDGIDRNAGTLHCTAALSTGVTTIATNDYIFQAPATSTGDFGNWLKGTGGWLPAVAPTVGGGDNWFGVDRSADVVRLAGLRIVGGGGPIEETIVQSSSLINREGGKTSHVFMNPLDWSKLVQALGSRTVYDRVTAFEKPEISFEAVSVATPSGKALVVSDLNCPQGQGRMLQMSTWKLHSLGQAPGIIDDDGLMIFRSANADEYEVRVGLYGNYGCEAPGYNATVTW